MTYYQPDFAAQALGLWNENVWNSTRVAEWSPILTAVATDTRTHDKTLQTPPAALFIGAGRGQLSNALSRLINRGLAGNLLSSQMAAALGAASGTATAPGNITRPFVTANASPPIVGTVLSTTNGTWAGGTTSFTYQWTRDGTVIGGAVAATYTLVSADTGGHQIRSIVSAVNATGTTVGPASNHISVP